MIFLFFSSENSGCQFLKPGLSHHPKFNRRTENAYTDCLTALNMRISLDKNILKIILRENQFIEFHAVLFSKVSNSVLPEIKSSWNILVPLKVTFKSNNSQ